MTESLVGTLLGAARMGLIVAALVVALLPIGQSAISGFCPTAEPTNGQTVPDSPPGDGDGEEPASDDPTGTDGGDGGDGGGTDAAPGGVVLTSAGRTTRLAQATDDPPNAETPGDGATSQVPGVAPSEEPVDPCGPGVDRCLPPLVSAVLVFGDGSCSAEAVSILRGRMLPAFGTASVLLVGAWLLRPRQGGAVISRW